MNLPKDSEDYPLWLLLATKQALYLCMEAPELGDARSILTKIDEALMSRKRSDMLIPGIYEEGK